MLSYTGTTRVVTVDLDVGDQRLASGRRGGRPSSCRTARPRRGTVATVGAVIDGRREATTPSPPIEVTVTVADQRALGDLRRGAGRRRVHRRPARADVLTVPVAALVALAEGGYGVQVVDGGTSRFVAVETGLFADGRVEVSGDGLADGH